MPDARVQAAIDHYRYRPLVADWMWAQLSGSRG
jgi:hypothetical protein